MKTGVWITSACASVLVMLAACAGGAAPRDHATTPRLPPPLVNAERPAEYPGLRNVVAFHDGFYAGGVPTGPEGFASLAGMGVKTIIAVDGAEPDVAAAKAAGLRYIHLPIGYHGFDETRTMELTRATRDAKYTGGVYLHCHHGKHRAAAAAAAVAVTIGWLTPEQGVARMKVSGTAPNYTGLYASAAASKPVPSGAIDAVHADFPEISRPKSLTKLMVAIDEVNDRLKAIEKAGWATPSDHPDLVPIEEAKQLAGLFASLAADHRRGGAGGSFNAILDRARSNAEAVLDGTRNNNPALAAAAFARVAGDCRSCHAAHRD